MTIKDLIWSAAIYRRFWRSNVQQESAGTALKTNVV